MQNFDVQLNLLLVNKALLIVWQCVKLCYSGVKRCPLFSTFDAALGQTLEKVANALRNIFYPFIKHLLNIGNVFKTDRITLQMRWEPLSTHCNALKMHYNAIFAKPGFPK